MIERNSNPETIALLLRAAKDAAVAELGATAESDALASDVYQLLVRADVDPSEKSIRSLARRIARNRVIDLKRSAAAHQRAVERQALEKGEAAPPEVDSALQGAIDRTVAALSAENQELLRLHLVNGLTLTAISKLHNVTPSAMSQRFKTCMGHLRSAMAREASRNPALREFLESRGLKL